MKVRRNYSIFCLVILIMDIEHGKESGSGSYKKWRLPSSGNFSGSRLMISLPGDAHSPLFLFVNFLKIFFLRNRQRDGDWKWLCRKTGVTSSELRITSRTSDRVSFGKRPKVSRNGTVSSHETRRTTKRRKSSA